MAQQPIFDVAIFTRDAHPENHCSFREQGGGWPVHCVRGTPGHEFSSSLTMIANHRVIDKATLPDQDAYSGFERTGLVDWLASIGVRRLLVTGLATDYCVQATALDAVREGFETWLALDAIAAVNAQPGDGDRAVLAMRRANIELTDSGQVATIFRAHPKPTALIVVDVQRDFCTGGALAVPGSDRIFGPLNALLAQVRPN